MVRELPTNDLPFIVVTDGRKTDSETRKLIRSHVMRGKNKIKARKKPRHVVHRDPQFAERVSTDRSVVLTPSMSRLLCSNFSAIRFADDAVDRALIADVVSFSSMFSKAMFVLNPCMRPKTAARERAWLTPLIFDAAYLNAICLTVQAFFDGYLSRTRSVEAQRRDYVYFAKTVRILQERLDCDDYSTKLSTPTVMTVLALSAHAYMKGDYESSCNHINGLLKLVSMRGVETFFQNPKLLIEILRSDLYMASDRISRPKLFTHENIPWSLDMTAIRMTEMGESSEQSSCETNTHPINLDPELDAIWAAMWHFCAAINRAAPETGIKISEEAFLHSMGAIMYRLLHLRFEPRSLDEVFRMGMLAFASPVFLNWNRVELPHPQFTAAYQEYLAGIDLTPSTTSAEERLWLLMVGALLMFHEPSYFAWIKPRLRASIEYCGSSSWHDVRRTLASFLWVELVYDQPGQDMYSTVMSD